jgi:hypothetical protein
MEWDVHVDLTMPTPKLMVEAAPVREAIHVAEMAQHVPQQCGGNWDGAARHNRATRLHQGRCMGSHPSITTKDKQVKISSIE